MTEYCHILSMTIETCQPIHHIDNVRVICDNSATLVILTQVRGMYGRHEVDQNSALILGLPPVKWFLTWYLVIGLIIPSQFPPLSTKQGMTLKINLSQKPLNSTFNRV